MKKNEHDVHACSHQLSSSCARPVLNSMKQIFREVTGHSAGWSLNWTQKNIFGKLHSFACAQQVSQIACCSTVDAIVLFEKRADKPTSGSQKPQCRSRPIAKKIKKTQKTSMAGEREVRDLSFDESLGKSAFDRCFDGFNSSISVVTSRFVQIYDVVQARAGFSERDLIRHMQQCIETLFSTWKHFWCRDRFFPSFCTYLLIGHVFETKEFEFLFFNVVHEFDSVTGVAAPEIHAEIVARSWGTSCGSRPFAWPFPIA